jgi:hypothetical protein
VTFFSPFESITDEERTHSYFTQDSAAEHATNYSNNVSNYVFEEGLIHRTFSPPTRSPNINISVLFICGETYKENVFRNLKINANHTYQNQTRVTQSFKGPEFCLRVKKVHFQHLL